MVKKIEQRQKQNDINGGGNNDKISSKDISIVIQGAIDKKCLKNVLICLRSTRKMLPESEIILSTWKNTDAEILKIIKTTNEKEKLYDILLLNDDPGAIKSAFYHGKETKFNNNIFRQILSSREGLKKTTRKYALKMRNDFEMKNTNFLNYFDKFDDYRMDEMKIFKKRIVVSSIYTCKVFYKNKGVLVQDNCFRFTDWWHFGLREDVLKLWDIHFENDPCYKGLADDKKDKKVAEKMLVPANYFHEEQYLWGNLAKMNDIDFEMIDETDYKLRNAIISEKLLVNNAVVVDFEKSGFTMLKVARRFSSKEGLYHYYDWLRLYQIYCNENVLIPNYFVSKYENLFNKAKNACFRHAIRINKAVNHCYKTLQGYRKSKHYMLAFVVDNIVMLLKVIYEMLSIGYYAVKVLFIFVIYLILKKYFSLIDSEKN